MAGLAFLTHVPFLRLAEEVVPFGPYSLWRMPFDDYDRFSIGAFSDHREAYEETAPVFLRLDADLDLPVIRPGAPSAGSVMEIKVPPWGWDTVLRPKGLGFVSNFHDLVDDAWAALLLAAPAGAWASPRLSQTFVLLHEPGVFDVLPGGRPSDGVRVQGDVDHELLFLPEGAGPPVDAGTIERAAALLQLVAQARRHPELSVALDMLCESTHPSLTLQEESTLAVTALEALLLPETRSGLGATFARRLGALLADAPGQAEALRRTARDLYDARSAGLHGGVVDPSREVVERACALRFLAASIERLAGQVVAGRELAELRTKLDRGSFGGVATPLPDDAALRAPQRLQRERPSVVGDVTGGMTAPQGVVVSWSPFVGLGVEGDLAAIGPTGSALVGLGVEGELAAVGPTAFVLSPLSGAEVLSMEDRDIRGDFVIQLHIVEDVGSCLYVREYGHDTVAAVGDDLLHARLMRRRDLACLSLRLAGFARFVDPELLGSYVYYGSLRARRPTVLRQTVLSMMRTKPGEVVRPADFDRVCDAWDRLAAYDAIARHPEVDHVLILVRRGHDARFLSPQARAGLLLAALEAMLGRFRRRDDPIQLEDLVAAVAGPDSPAATWFRTDGRAFRNAIAHGRWSREEEPLDAQARQIDQLLRAVDPTFVDPWLQPLEHLGAIVRAAVPALVEAWLAHSEREGRRPGRVLVDRLSARLLG
jgi:hypothetical protein